MRLDDLRPTENVDDRRGLRGRGVALGGGGLGIVAVAVIVMLLGGDPTQILSQMGDISTAPTDSTAPTGPRADDASFQFSRKIVGSTEDVWTKIFAARGLRYEPAIFTPYDGSTQTGCGAGQSMMGPFYCSADKRVYIDLSFFDELRTRFGAPGEFAQAYVLAHEVGHHVQDLLGTMANVQARYRGAMEGADGGSVRLELQADCYAGVWAYNANRDFSILEQGDVEQGLAAANAVGDDTLQRQTQGRVAPDSFTHGSSAQRVRWFTRGMQTGDMNQCDTFSATTL
ncbi:MAG: zinc metallopeptidase [Alphaproteobacteria bacterium]|nr:zinc metallopeptidase [Alphaproteobacteria bacterium]MBN9558212.1 zinc metallopeptidase [Alphaproteobacteria bacterium]